MFPLASSNSIIAPAITRSRSGLSIRLFEGRMMPKLITPKRLQGNIERARAYVRTYILFPSGFLGLIFLVSGMASLGYQMIFIDTYTGETFIESTGLLLLGGILGWLQTRYQRYLLQAHPDHFASRMKSFSPGGPLRSKRNEVDTATFHPGRQWVPLAYLVGGITILVASALSSIFGQVYYVAAYLLPWAGLFCAKLFFWRGVLPSE